MEVIKTETGDGTLKSLTFRAENEGMEDFRVAVKAWIAANYPNVTPEQMFDKLVPDGPKITINMQA